MPEALSAAITVFLGLCLGSFATALSYRLPREISMTTKARSSCPTCGHNLGVYDLVPLFSWLALRGKCRHCSDPIGGRYPLIELATLALCLAFYLTAGLTPHTVVLFLLAPVLVSMIDIDLRYKLIPDVLNLSILLLGILALLAEGDSAAIPPAVFGAVLYGGGAALLRTVFMHLKGREPMGLGDVKFFAAAGFWLGPLPETAGIFLTLAGGSGVALALVWRKLKGEEEFPFGPALVLAFTALLLI